MESTANSLKNQSKAELISALGKARQALHERELLFENQLQQHRESHPKQLAQRDHLISLLHEKLRLLRAQGYGARSEQRGNDPQADLFNEVDALGASADSAELEAGNLAGENAPEPTQTLTCERRH